MDDQACLLACFTSESGTWINALPVASLDTLLSGGQFPLAVAVRLGEPVCSHHSCCCGKIADVMGYHSLSCKRALVEDRVMRS